MSNRGIEIPVTIPGADKAVQDLRKITVALDELSVAATKARVLLRGLVVRPGPADWEFVPAGSVEAGAGG